MGKTGLRLVTEIYNSGPRSGMVPDICLPPDLWAKLKLADGQSNRRYRRSWKGPSE